MVLHNKKYELVVDGKHDLGYRHSFNQLTQDIFGFNFEDWYVKGYWGAAYFPYSMVHCGNVVSNVSISLIDFAVDEHRKIGVQIGTVMTHPEYRNQGLSRYLMEFVLEQWKARCDFIYLFANDSVMDFYPKFDFVEVDEYCHSIMVCGSGQQFTLKRLDMEDVDNRNLVERTIMESVPQSKLSMLNNISLLMFYCLYVEKNNIYYDAEHNLLIIAEFNGDTVYLKDVFSKEQVNIGNLVQSISSPNNRVILGFTPLDETGFEKSRSDDDTTLFILDDHAQPFCGNEWMFPVLSHA